jgi:hypothetical protein
VVPPITNVKVCGETVVLVTTMFVTIVVVEDGVVYRVPLDVAAAPLYKVFDVVAINYYLL